MKPFHWAIMVMWVCACFGQGYAFEEITSSPVVFTRVGAERSQWGEAEWGTLGVAHLRTAPFPDDSRTTGFVSKRGVFPFKGHYDDDRVAFVIPKGFRPSREVDLIVHFHGHYNQCVKAIAQFRLGELLAASGRNAILIVPQGPKDAPDSGGGKLEKPEAFRAFVEEALGVLQRNDFIPANAQVRHIVLSGHSGAYRVMAQILDHGGLTERIGEVWLFDAAYGFWDELAAPFAAPNSTKRLRSIFTEHLAGANVAIMSRLALSGAKFMVVSDDLLTTSGTPREALEKRKFGRRKSAPADELVDLLRREPRLFIYTSLGHNDVMTARRYFELFARESPVLRPR
ncbi:MAG: hypothetical protein D6691_10325 [Candidatus Hydrogenedentota bacterium]|jgi:hypothetical protein|nr:MAG: hypothetical protein D6691_10325 [Candidatus Hydrogenedentota bacterium]